jgi:hypothetical protein
MPAAITSAITGFSSLAAAAAAGSALGYAHSAMLATHTELCASREIMDVGKALIEAHAAGALQIDLFPKFDPRKRLIGPIVCVGECLAAVDFLPGDVAFVDPTISVCGDEIVFVLNRQSQIGRAIAGFKILDCVGDDWYLRSTDGAPPVLLCSEFGVPVVQVLGAPVVRLRLPPSSAVRVFAQEATAKMLKAVAGIPPPGSIAAAKALATRTSVDRSPYIWRSAIGERFWERDLPQLGLSSVDPAAFAKWIASESESRSSST